MAMRARKFAGRVRSYAARRARALLGDEENLRAAQQKIAEKNERMVRLREQLSNKEREISRLRSRMGEGQTNAASSVEIGMPVFFIIGFAKSGTSWLMRTLNYHPEILCTGEGLFFGRGADLDQRRGTVAPSSLYGVFADSEHLRAWLQKSAWTRGDDPEEHITNLTHTAIDYVFGQKLDRTGGARKWIVGDKTPFVSEETIEEIERIYPGAKVIHIIRDGRDVAVSAVHHMWNHALDAGGHLTVSPEELETRDAYRKDPETFRADGRSLFDEGRLRNGFARSWYDMTTRAIEDGPRLLGENYTEVRYEDLLERPVEETRRLLAFLGADAGEEAAKKCVDAASFETWTKGRERGKEESTAFLRKGVAGDWKESFTEADKRVFKEATGDLLVRLGYEKNGGW